MNFRKNDMIYNVPVSVVSGCDRVFPFQNLSLNIKLIVCVDSSTLCGTTSCRIECQFSKFCITRTCVDQKKCYTLKISSWTMFLQCGNDGKVWESCKSYAIIRVINVRVMRSLPYTCVCNGSS